MFGLEFLTRFGKQVLFAGPTLLFKFSDAINIAASSSRPGCYWEVGRQYSMVLEGFSINPCSTARNG